MTDDRKLTAVEWRLYLVAALAAIYILTWRVLDRPSPGGEVIADTEPSGARPSVAVPSPRAAQSPATPRALPMAHAAPTAHAAPAAQPAPRVPPVIAPRAVWFDELPASQRPTIVPPAGWVIVDRRSIARVARTPATPTTTSRRVSAPAADGAPSITPTATRAPTSQLVRPVTPTIRRAPGTRPSRRVRTRSS